MNIIQSIEQAKRLLNQIAQLNLESEALNRIHEQLEIQLDFIHAQAKQMCDSAPQLPTNSRPEIKNGCYVFKDEKGFFCPYCFDLRNNKVITTRINSQMRVCPACKKTIMKNY